MPKKPPIMKNRTDEIDSWPAPQRLGMKLPMNPPTNPPVYVGPLRTNPSSDNSTAETMNCSGSGQTADALNQLPTRRVGRVRRAVLAPAMASKRLPPRRREAGSRVYPKDEGPVLAGAVKFSGTLPALWMTRQ
jgi:hypothetical protein